nr:IS3 family transposase [Paraburkholderia kururiensis]
MGVTRACGLVGISRSLFQYESRRRVDDEALTGRMMAIAAQKRRYGYRRIHVLLQREGWLANHKRIWRLYSKAGLECAQAATQTHSCCRAQTAAGANGAEPELVDGLRQRRAGLWSALSLPERGRRLHA